MGVIWRTRDRSLNRDVAVKVLSVELASSPSATRRFLEEARITGQLQHPSIPAIYEIGVLPTGAPFLAMKLIEGRTLLEEIARGRERGALIAIFEQIAQAVAFAHSRSVIHRDLKPSNVMVGAFGEVQVMDWGLAKNLRHSEETSEHEAEEPTSLSLETRAGSVLGTPSFMPPEQAAGDLGNVDRRADVFGLGGILCVMLTGKPPYVPSESESTIEMATRVRLDDAFTRLDASGADSELIALAKRCLAALPADRPADAGEVATTVGQWRAATELRAREAELAHARLEVRSAEERKRRRVRFALGLSLFVILGIVGLVTYGWQRVRDARSAEKFARTEQIERDVEAGVRRMDELLADTRNWPDYPTRQWTPVLAAQGELDRVESAASSDDCPHSVKETVVQARERWEAVHRNTRLIIDLEAIRFAVLEIDWRNSKRTPSLDNRYRSIFASAGIDPYEGPPGIVAEKICNHPHRANIRSALYTWRGVGKLPDGLERLNEVIRLADPIGDSILDKWRVFALANKGPELAEFALSESTLSQPPLNLTGLAGDLEMLGQSPAAISLLMKMHEGHPGDFWTNEQLAEMLARAKPSRLELALRYSSAAMACRPESVPAILLHGSLLAMMQDHQAALTWFRRAAAIDPTFSRLKTNLAGALERTGQLEEARQALEDALRERPDDDIACSNLAELRIKTGDIPGAIEALVALREIVPDDDHIEGIMRRALLKLGEGETCIAALKHLIKDQPKVAALRYALGRTLLASNQRTEALVEFRLAVQFERCSTYLSELALALGSDDRHFPEAKLLVAEASKRNTHDSAPYYVLGCLHRDRGEMDDALRCFDRSVALWPRDSLARKEIAAILAKSGKKDDALDVLRDWIRKSPLEEKPYDQLTRALLRRREFPECLRVCEAWLNVQPRTYEPYRRLVEYHRAVGDLPAARVVAVREKEMIERQPMPADYILREANEVIRTLHLEIPVDAQLKDILAGKHTPASASEWLKFALHANKARRHDRTATEFFRKAFAMDATLETSTATTRHRLQAAEAAIIWALDISLDSAAPAEPTEVAKLYQAAYRWLRAELDALTKEAQTSPPNIIRHRCSFWIHSPTLKEFRLPANRSKIPEKELADWDKLWLDVESLSAAATLKAKK